MSKRSKQKRILEVKNFPNVIDGLERNSSEKTNDFFEYDKAAVLELGCGQGTYTIELAKLNPDKLFMGIDIQGERLWYGAKEAQHLNLQNVIFLRTPIETLLEYIPDNSISEIWITFPDPFPRDKQEKKRLTSIRFLEIYKKILEDDGVLHLKTDDDNLFVYSQELLEKNGFKLLEVVEDIYKKESLNHNLLMQTPFEKKHLNNNKTIHYLKASRIT